MSLKYLNLTGLSRVITNLKNWVTSQIPTKTSEITNDSGFITGTSDCVHTTGNETIAGEKTFTAFPVVKATNANNGIIYIKSPTTFGTAPSGTTYTYALRCVDNAGTILADFLTQQSTNGANSIQLRVRNTDGTLVYDRRVWISVATNGTTVFVPNADDVFYLGYSNLKWKAVYSNSYYLGTTAFGDIVTHNASEYSLSSHTHTKSEITDFPTIPTVNNATLTIQKNGTTVKTFTANASSNVTCNITVPTTVSELINDSGFLTSHQSLSNYVTLNSAQTISAVKTFTAGPLSTATNYPSFTVKNTAHTVGEAAPSSTFGYGEFLVKDSAGYSIGLITVYYDKNQTMYFRIQARNKFTNGVPAVDGTEIGSCLDIGTIKDGTRYIYWNGYVGNGVIPRVNNSYTLGDSDHKWKTCYATNFYGALTGNVTGNCSGSSGSCTGNAATATTAGNVTGTVAIANGGTGATTRLNAVKALTNENVGTNTTYFLTITDSWGKAGYCSVANAKTVLGLGSAAYTASTAYATASHTHSYLPLSGGTLTGNVKYKRSDATRGTAPSSNVTIQHCDAIDSANNRFTLIETTYYTDKSSKIALFAYKTTAATGANIGSIGIGCTASGTVYTFAPTPAANDNSTKIATTAWVTAKGYLTSHQSLSNYVTLNGAQTITAEKTFKSDIVFNGTYNLRSSADNSYVRIQGGSGEGKGSRIILSGKTRSGLQGYAEIVATDGTNTNTFTVKPNGETLVNGNNLAATIIKGLSISGKTITYTQINGSTGTITTQDTVYTHPTTAGNKHIPSGGSTGKILRYSEAGTASWDYRGVFISKATRTSAGNWTISSLTTHGIYLLIGTVKRTANNTSTISLTNAAILCGYTSCNGYNTPKGNNFTHAGTTADTVYIRLMLITSNTSITVDIPSAFSEINLSLCV